MSLKRKIKMNRVKSRKVLFIAWDQASKSMI